MMDVDEQQIIPDPLPFARSYQLEALEQAVRENTIVYLETGSGKTLIATMLLRSYTCHLRKPSPYIAVFLVPKVVLIYQHELSGTSSDLTADSVKFINKKMSKILESSISCLEHLGVWFALKAMESALSSVEAFSRGNSGYHIVKEFISAATMTLQTYVPSDPQWTIGENMNSDVEKGLLTSKVSCLIDCLLEYRGVTEMRCIVFVERVIAARVLPTLLNTLLPKYNSWKVRYITGKHNELKSQSAKIQDEIVEEFRKGSVNVIVATSVLEEGLDVQNCNLVIRFDLPRNVCSFVQSRGRARMQNSDYILMLESGDFAAHSRIEKYIASEEMMRKESLHYSSLPCESPENERFDEQSYRVASTGAVNALIRTPHNGCTYITTDILDLDGNSPLEVGNGHSRDAVLDYLITLHLYKEYPGMTSGMLTDMRAASVNNDCYAKSAIRVQLHKHVLHTSPELHKHIADTLVRYSELSSSSTFGWECEASFPKVSRSLEIILLLS
ncbi:hypothetical protein TSUD_176570 [Trifolium subterraneum]|uniref:Helicase C-terminal domain-containing protein n=1 Tax=Trifolium subterraneum TaxID=3900 RepID=A0A2Z6LRQ9_TRISU|nr:hypothetical protein TSUD_176570 [Trifolium subterraneum]